MKFTLIFPSGEATDLSVGMTFQPCIVWMLGNKILFNAGRDSPHRESPYYEAGDFRVLVDILHAKNLLGLPWDKMEGMKIFIVVHAIGHGREDDLRLLEKDIVNEKLIPVSIR